jgi:hypothetical protein
MITVPVPFSFPEANVLDCITLPMPSPFRSVPVGPKRSRYAPHSSLKMRIEVFFRGSLFRFGFDSHCLCPSAVNAATVADSTTWNVGIPLPFKLTKT